MALYDTKGIFASKTVWGGVVALLAGGTAIFGYSVSETDQASLVEAVSGIASAVGGLIAIYGRVTATKAIGK
jgi:multidrug resistance efflux pump